jgi:hypothetical protein
VTDTRLDKLLGNIYTNGAHKNNNDNNTTPIFRGLHKTTQKNRRRNRKVAQEKIKSDVLRQMYLNVNNENAITLDYFNLRTNAF